MKKTQTIKLALLGAAFVATHAIGQNSQQMPQDSLAPQPSQPYQRQMPVEPSRTRTTQTKTPSVNLPKIRIARSATKRRSTVSTTTNYSTSSASQSSVTRGGFGGSSRRSTAS